MKRITKAIAASAIALLCLSHASAVMAADTIGVRVNGTELTLDQPPVIEDGRTLAPLRAVTEALGLQVTYDEGTQTVTAAKDGLSLKLTIGVKTAYVNDEPVELDAPAKIINGRTMVPVRFIGEASGMDVGWDDESRTVIIGAPGVPAPEAAAPEAPKGSVHGEMNGDVYTNDYFGVTMTLPQGWYVLDTEQLTAVYGMALDILTGDDALETALSDSATNIPLLTAYAKNPTLSNRDNSAITMEVEMLPEAALIFIKTPLDYMEAVKSSLGGITEIFGVEATYAFENIESCTISGKPAAKMGTLIDVGGGLLSMNQDYYSILVDGYALSLTLTYYNDEQKSVLLNALDSLTLE